MKLCDHAPQKEAAANTPAYKVRTPGRVDMNELRREFVVGMYRTAKKDWTRAPAQSPEMEA